MSEIEVNGNTYMAGKMNAMKQFHVARRLVPVLVAMGINSAQVKEAFSRSPNLADMEAMLIPASAMLAQMSNEDSEYIITNCLACVKRKQGDGWAQVQSDPGVFMFADIDMLVMLRLVLEALRVNLEGFLQGLGGATPLPSS